MSEKRFMIDYEVGVLDTKTDEIICDCQGSAEEVVALLNQLVDENEQLRKLYKVYEQAEKVEEKAKDCLIDSLKEDNEQLRKEKDDLQKYVNKIEDDYYDYYAMTLRNAEWLK